MWKRAATLLLVVVSAGALVVAAMGTAGASVATKAKPPLCAGKTKNAAFKGIKLAYTAFLDGVKYPTAADKEPYLQLLSGKTINADFKTQFEARAAATAVASKTTSVAVDKITCAGKKKADVIFTLVLSGTRAEGLAAPGQATLEGKLWKVTAVTICDFQALGDPTVLDAEPCATIVANG